MIAKKLNKDFGKSLKMKIWPRHFITSARNSAIHFVTNGVLSETLLVMTSSKKMFQWQSLVQVVIRVLRLITAPRLLTWTKMIHNIKKLTISARHMISVWSTRLIIEYITHNKLGLNSSLWNMMNLWLSIILCQLSRKFLNIMEEQSSQ